MNYLPIHLTSIDGFLEFPIVIRWEAVAYLRSTPENSTRQGTFIYLLDGRAAVWVKETREQILAQVKTA